MGVDFINIVLPLLVKFAVDSIQKSHFQGVVWAGGLFLILMLFQSWGRYLWRVYLIGASHKIARKLRLDLYEHLQRLPLGYYQRVRSGDLMSRATNDVEAVRMSVGPGILVTADAIVMFSLIVPAMVWLSPKLSLLAFAFYPLVPFLTARVGDRIDVMFESLQVKLSNIGAFAQETFGGIRLIKSLVLESEVQRRFENLSSELRSQGVLLAKYEAVFSPALGFITNLGTLLILILGGQDVLSGAITVGTFIAFQRFVVQLSWPMEAIGWTVTMHREGAAAYRRVTEIMDVPPVRATLFPPEPRESKFLLSIHNLNFNYRVAGQNSPFRLRIEGANLSRGKKVGIVGPVGAGKSTLFHLILRLYEPSSETIFLEGSDVLSIPLYELRNRIGSVEQQVFLFSEQILSNIGLGARDEISSGDLKALVDVAQVGAEIYSLEKGFESALGERGVNLSGGQKQRIALVRALARKPELLLLDDAFSAVDVSVEKRIIEKFFSHYPDLSVIFASHRLSVMPKMDQVWVMEHGEILDMGTHSELLSRCRTYQLLWEKSERGTHEANLRETAGELNS